MARKVEKKTAKKTAKSPRNGQEIPLGNHPGNTGGKKGRSGRKPMAFKLLAHDILHDPVTQAQLRKAAQNPKASGYSTLVLGLAKYSEGLEGMVSLEELHRYLEQLGIVLARHIKDPSVFAAIEADAGALPLPGVAR